jgi:uncharacterized protein (TIGR02246 family)
MKFPHAVCVWLVCAFLGAPSAHAEPAAGRVVRDSVERLAQAWNASDANRWAAEYWSDGELINILGMVLAGSDQVRDRTADILIGPFRGSHFAFVVRSIRFVGPDAVIVDTDITITGFRGLPPGIEATRPGELLTRMKHVYERRRGDWRIVTSQNTAVATRAVQRELKGGE